MKKFVLIGLLVVVLAGGFLWWQYSRPVLVEPAAEEVIFDNSATSSLVFVGDVMLDRFVGDIIDRRNDVNFPFAKVAGYLNAADVVFANLECTISDKGKNVGSIYSFRADPKVIDGLKYAGLDVVSVANNHIFDWGRDALVDTSERLNAANIATVGSGKNESQANKPKVFNLKGGKVAYLAYTNLYPKSLLATADTPGISHFDIESVMAQIREANKLASVIVVSFHWGDEYATTSNASQKEIAHAAVDAGASLVIGHHPHVPQEVEKYKNSWIVYSLGNFVFDQNFSPDTEHGLVAEAVMKGGSIIDLKTREVKFTREYQPYFPE